jgi:hypothetical protein
MLIKFNTTDTIYFFFFFVLVNNQKNIESQLGIHVIDSGIGNPRRVRNENMQM